MEKKTKTTRSSASERRSAKVPGHWSKFKLDAFPDKIDTRDWFYQPGLFALPDQIDNRSKVPLILNQGREGACTGFALAAVINFHLVNNGRCTVEDFENSCASPRMLYELARKYDEWPGEHYEGSSARGSIKGWVAHGVVKRNDWKNAMHGLKHFNDDLAVKAMNIPAGSYYRVQHKEIRDMHAAIYESGILFATLMVHSGWDDPSSNNGIPVIKRKLPASDGHAIAIVGYNRDGFIIQNSWGTGWGEGGFALLPYEDWLLHASDCWVAQLGVPLNINIWQSKGYASSTAGRQRASQSIPLSEIRPFIIDIGNNGYLSTSGQYWTNKEDIDRMFQGIGQHFTSQNTKDKKCRVMLYLHGGLNSESEVARRVISFKDVFLENNIYPIHIMWETDWWSSLKSDVIDLFTNDDKSSANWLEKVRDGVIEIKDRALELTFSKPGTLLWDEMKENARLACEKQRAIDILVQSAQKAYSNLTPTEKKNWELHIIGHSAGSIITAYAIEKLLQVNVPIRTVQFMAPAIRIDLFKQKILPLVKAKKCPLPTLYILSEDGELDDLVGPYGKSLLYLVSNSFEDRRETPILGMQKFLKENKELMSLYESKNSPWKNIVVAGSVSAGKEDLPNNSRSDSHGGFDNDKDTMNSVLFRILGRMPDRKFEVRDLQY